MKNPILKAGIVLGLVVEVWTFIYGFSGMYRSTAAAMVFPLIAIVIQAGVMAWGLRMTAALGKRYGGQILAGLLICLVAAVIIFFGSLLFTTVVFPDYLTELRDVQADMMAQRGMTAEQIEQQMAMTAPLQTPLMQAIFGVIGTVVTGLILSLILAIFFRHKG